MTGTQELLVIVLLLAAVVVFAYFYLKRAQARPGSGNKTAQTSETPQTFTAPATPPPPQSPPPAMNESTPASPAGAGTTIPKPSNWR